MTEYQTADQLHNYKNQEVREPTATQHKKGFICWGGWWKDHGGAISLQTK